VEPTDPIRHLTDDSKPVDPPAPVVSKLPEDQLTSLISSVVERVVRSVIDEEDSEGDGLLVGIVDDVNQTYWVPFLVNKLRFDPDIIRTLRATTLQIRNRLKNLLAQEAETRSGQVTSFKKQAEATGLSIAAGIRRQKKTVTYYLTRAVLVTIYAEFFEFAKEANAYPNRYIFPNTLDTDVWRFLNTAAETPNPAVSDYILGIVRSVERRQQIVSAQRSAAEVYNIPTDDYQKTFSGRPVVDYSPNPQIASPGKSQDTRDDTILNRLPDSTPNSASPTPPSGLNSRVSRLQVAMENVRRRMESAGVFPLSGFTRSMMVDWSRRLIFSNQKFLANALYWSVEFEVRGRSIEDIVENLYTLGLVGSPSGIDGFYKTDFTFEPF
jgi:hypothetical protein